MFRFISERILKDRSIINGNVDTKLIGPMIDEVQEFYILPILGTALYNSIGESLPSPSVANKALLDDYVIPCMIKYLEYEAYTTLGYKLTNANVSQKNTDESTPINLEDTFRLQNRVKNKAEWYAERITKFLIANPETYPLYLQSGTTSDTIHPVRTNYTSGMWLGSGYGCSCNKSTCIQCQTNMRTSQH